MNNSFLIWLKAAGIRAVKTIAQAAIAAIGSTATVGAVDWKIVLETAALAGILSLLTSTAGLPEVELLKNKNAAEQQPHEQWPPDDENVG